MYYTLEKKKILDILQFDTNCLLTAFSLVVVSFILLHEKDQNLSEDLHEVNEKVQRVSDEILVSAPSFLDYHLSVPHDESTENQKSTPQVHLENQLGLEKDVQESQPKQG